MTEDTHPEDPSLSEALTDPALHEMMGKCTAAPWGLIRTHLSLSLDLYAAHKES